MTIAFTVDSLDKVEESMREVYVESDGKFTLDVDKYADFKAQGLKTKNKELLDKYTKAKGFQDRAEKFKDVDDEDFEAFLEFKAKRDDPANKGDDGKEPTVTKEFHDRAVKKAKGEIEKERDALAGENTSLKEENRQFKIWNPVQEAATKAGVLPDRLAPLITVLQAKTRFDLTEKGKLVFKDSDGDETELSIEKAFDSLKKEFPWAFKASDVGGSGARAGNNGADGSSSLSGLSASERLKAARRQKAS